MKDDAMTIRTIAILTLLLAAGCDDGTAAGQRPEDDAGTGGAQAGDAGTGGKTGSGGASGSGGQLADAGTGGSSPGTGGAGSGGATGTGGAQGGTGGGTVETPKCVDPDGWPIKSTHQCMKPDGRGGFDVTKKGGHVCATNCQSTRPGGAAGNYIGPPSGPECTFGDDLFICVAACSECQ